LVKLCAFVPGLASGLKEHTKEADHETSLPHDAPAANLDGRMGAAANSGNDRTGLREVSVPTGQSIIVGCLQGNPHNYRLTEKDGTSHLLMGESDALSGHVNHSVQLVGFEDNDRDPSASSDEDTPHGLRFFRVENIASDMGSCK